MTQFKSHTHYNSLFTFQYPTAPTFVRLSGGEGGGGKLASWLAVYASYNYHGAGAQSLRMENHDIYLPWICPYRVLWQVSVHS